MSDLLGAAQLLLKNGFDIGAKDLDKEAALYWAAENGHQVAVRLLVDENANIASKDKDGRTALHSAAEYGRKAVVQLLLRKGAYVDEKDNEGHSALISAAEQGYKNVVQLLLNKKADIAAVDNDGWTALHYAARYNHVAVVQLLLERGANVGVKTKRGHTALILAKENDHDAVVKLLFEKTTKNSEISSSGSAALLLSAAEYGHMMEVKELLNNGTDINFKDENGRTALSLAAENGHEATVKLLIERGAKLDSKDKKGRGAMSWAAEYGYDTIVRLLFEKGTNADSKDEDSRTALWWAARFGHESTVRVLTEMGAEVDSSDKDYGQTPLSAAAENGHESVVKLLLQKGAKVDSEVAYGMTPLCFAAEEGHEAVVKLLVQNGANINSRSYKGRTALSLAEEKGYDAVVKLLLEKDSTEASKKDAKDSKETSKKDSKKGSKKASKKDAKKNSEASKKDAKKGSKEESESDKVSKYYCSVCHNLDPAGPVDEDDRNKVGSDLRLWDRTLVELKSSSQSGCQFCSVVLQACRLRSEPWYSLNIYLDINQHPQIAFHAFKGAWVDDFITIYATEQISSWKYLLTKRDISSDPASDISFSFLMNRLNDCLSNHKTCRQTASYLPKRVIDVGLEIKSVVLFEPEERSKSPYVALSHCWGKNELLMTTKLSIHARKRSIEWSSLPKTFQDAITITRKLGLRYLWVDSLCIVQDDYKDWQTESAKMAAVYEQAYITICASSSSGGDKSFLAAKGGPDWEPLVLENTAFGGLVKAQRRRPGGVHARSMYENRTRDPLDERGWCLQERLLSTRLISYSIYELQWSCKSLYTCECQEPVTSASSDTLVTGKDVFKFWHQQVSEYTCRSLTKTRDKLPALMGIATKINSITGSKYVAGLWVDNLHKDLLWKHPKYLRSTLEVTSSFRAPTFSWASVDGPVEYNSEYPEDSYANFCKVLDAHCTLSYETPFGEVKDGFITLSSLLIPATIRMGTRENEDVLRHEYELIWGDEPTYPKKFEADVLLTARGDSNRNYAARASKNDRHLSQASGWILPIRNTTHSWDPQVEGLILGPSARNLNSYERLGYIAVEVSHEEFPKWNSRPRQTVRIV